MSCFGLALPFDTLLLPLKLFHLSSLPWYGCHTFLKCNTAMLQEFLEGWSPAFNSYLETEPFLELVNPLFFGLEDGGVTFLMKVSTFPF